MRIGYAYTPESAYLHRVERTSRALGMELYTPHVLSRFSRRLDPLNGRVVTVDEERLPAIREWILELQRVLMVLAAETTR